MKSQQTPGNTRASPMVFRSKKPRPQGTRPQGSGGTQSHPSPPFQGKQLPPWKILIVDDDKDIHDVTRLVLDSFTFENRPLSIESVYSASEARDYLKQNNDIAVILLDVVMEEDESGLELVNFIRDELDNRCVRIILRTGQPGAAPEEQVIREYDINDYRAKSELTSAKLTMSVLTALRSYRDITESLRLAEEKNRAEQQEEQAKQASHAKTEFLAQMSHEIRTPMSAVIAITDILLSMDMPEAQREHIETLKTAGEALLSVINDILDFSKIEAGKLEIDEHPFSLHKICEQAHSVFSIQASIKGINFKLNEALDQDQLLMGDSNRIRQIIFNLLSNAIKFTPEGGNISLDIQTDNQDEHSVIHITISDTGVGIPEDKIDSLFKPFVQAESSTSRKYGGTGLGLVICKKLVELMGGNIQVSSHENQGTTFRVDLQLSHATSQSSLEKAATSSSQPAAKTRVLLVEDNPINQKVASAILKKLGYPFDLAQNGAEAVAMVEKNTYQLVLMDCHMPVMDGYTATREIRKKLSSKELPIVALTAAATSNEKEKCEACGMDGFLPKPYTMAQFKEKIEQWH